MGIKTDEYESYYKKDYQEVLEQYDLFENEEDLFTI